MERTKQYFVFNVARKPLINKGFRGDDFQSGLFLSSAARYDHFDTSPYLIVLL